MVTARCTITLIQATIRLGGLFFAFLHCVFEGCGGSDVELLKYSVVPLKVLPLQIEQHPSSTMDQPQKTTQTRFVLSNQNMFWFQTSPNVAKHSSVQVPSCSSACVLSCTGFLSSSLQLCVKTAWYGIGTGYGIGTD